MGREKIFATTGLIPLWLLITRARRCTVCFHAEKWLHAFARSGQFLFILIFTGCAIQERISDDALSLAWEENSLRLQQVQDWNLKGRIAIQLEKEGASASLVWQQNEQDYVIRIIAPFNRGSLEIKGDSKGVSMRDANDQLLHARDPETLLQARLGWQVPLSGLRYWIRGLPDPAEQIKTLVLDNKARIHELSQAGWQVSYGPYTQIGDINLPKKLTMQNQNLKIKLVIKHWGLSR